MLDRLTILQKFPFITDRNLPMIISNDLDGFCSAVLMHHLKNWQIVGFYDSESVWIANDEENGSSLPAPCSLLNNLVWLDLDIADSRCRSIGHHILTQNSSDVPVGFANSLNPNLELGIARQDFTKKYPFSTFVFLLWLFQFEKPISETAKSLFLHADSVWINAQLYRENVNRWLDWMPFPMLENALKKADSPGFERTMQTHLFSKFDGIKWIRKSGQKRSKHLKLETSQLQMNPDWDTAEMRKLVEFIGNSLDWKVPNIPSNLEKITGKRFSTQTETIFRRYKNLSNWIDAELIFSYAMPSFRTINYTKLMLNF